MIMNPWRKTTLLGIFLLDRPWMLPIRTSLPLGTVERKKTSRGELKSEMLVMLDY